MCGLRFMPNDYKTVTQSLSFYFFFSSYLMKYVKNQHCVDYFVVKLDSLLQYSKVANYYNTVTSRYFPRI